MNTQLVPYEPGADGNPTPSELRACWETLAPKLADLMQLFGLQRVTSTYQRLGMVDVGKLTLQRLPYGDNPPPEAFVLLQHKAARWLADGLQLFGLLGQSVSMSEEELKVVQGSWLALRQRAAELNGPPVPLTAKMPPDVDPTGKDVLGGPEQPVDNTAVAAGTAIRPAGTPAPG